MADKLRLNYSAATDIINQWKATVKPNKEGRYNFKDLLELDQKICGFLCESKKDEGIYYSYHTMNWLLQQLDSQVVFEDSLIDYTGTGTFSIGASWKISFTSNNLPICNNPLTRDVMDRKMQAALPLNSYIEKYGAPAVRTKFPATLDSHLIEFNKQRTRVKVIAETTGLGYMVWLKPEFVLTKMQEANNACYAIAVEEQKRLEQADYGYSLYDENTEKVIVDEKVGTTKVSKTKKVKTTENIIPPVKEIVPPEAPTPPVINQANQAQVNTPTMDASQVAQTSTPNINIGQPQGLPPTININNNNQAPVVQQVVQPTQPTQPTGAVLTLPKIIELLRAPEILSNGETVSATATRIVKDYFNNVKQLPTPNFTVLTQDDYTALASQFAAVGIVW